jgi:hypothetical protein
MDGKNPFVSVSSSFGAWGAMKKAQRIFYSNLPARAIDRRDDRAGGFGAFV